MDATAANALIFTSAIHALRRWFLLGKTHRIEAQAHMMLPANRATLDALAVPVLDDLALRPILAATHASVNTAVPKSTVNVSPAATLTLEP